MAAKTRKQNGKPSKPRASWRGALSFGMVSFPVEAYNAMDRKGSDIHFHQIHAECHERIHYRKVCPVHGEVNNDEIVSGYEVKKGKYVELEPEELASLRTDSDKALRIDAFVAPDAIDPLYFDGRMYYLMPGEPTANEAYAVVQEAMEREGRYAVAHLIMSGKDQIALLRPLAGLLHMAMLNYEAEIRPPRKTAAAIKKPTNISRQVRLAQTLVQEWSQDQFDFSKYEDKHREQVQKLIDSKLRGETIAPPEEEAPTEILNLMDALKRSVDALTARSHRHRRKPAAKRQSA